MLKQADDRSDITNRGDVCEPHLLVGQQRRNEFGKSGILGTSHPHLTAKHATTLDT
jgi:hypothetical protein